MPETFGVLDDMVQAGKLLHYGVSVEKVEEALKAIEYPNVKTVQIIFNIFRQRPADLFFKEALRKKIGIIVRVPLASGMLTGKLNKQSTFEADDHRAFNRHGESFDRGETFAGVDYDTGLKVVDELRPLVPEGWSMPQFALRWILMHEAVSCTIPGAKNPKQAEDNASASDLPEITPDAMEEINKIYQNRIRALVHHYW